MILIFLTGQTWTFMRGCEGYKTFSMYFLGAGWWWKKEVTVHPFAQMESHWNPSPVFCILCKLWILKLHKHYGLLVNTKPFSRHHSCLNKYTIEMFQEGILLPIWIYGDMKYWLLRMLTSKVPPELLMPTFKIITEYVGNEIIALYWFK